MWYKSKGFSQRWNSLTELELKCINEEFVEVLYSLEKNFIDPCKDPKDICISFCKNSKILEKTMHSNKKLKDLILLLSNPTNVDQKGSKLVPFCHIGYDTERFITMIKKGTISLSNATNVYKFCNNTFQSTTDIGICTTISFDKVSIFKQI